MSRNIEIFNYVSNKPTWENVIFVIRHWQDYITTKFSYWLAILIIISVAIVFFAAFEICIYIEVCNLRCTYPKYLLDIFSVFQLNPINSLYAVGLLLFIFYFGGLLGVNAETPIQEVLPPIVPSTEEVIHHLPRNIQPNNYELFIKPDIFSKVITGNISLYFKVLEDTNVVKVNVDEIVIRRVWIEGPNTTLKLFSSDLSKKDQLFTVTARENMTKGFFYTMRIVYEGKLREDNKGFYLGKYYEDGEEKLFAVTQFEPNFARSAFPCMDDPYFKATFLIHIITPVGYNALSNSMAVFTESKESQWVTVTFILTHIMPTYLVAMLISQFDYVRTPHLLYSIHGRKKMIREKWGQFALEEVAKLHDYFDTYTGILYPPEKLDQVGIPNDYFNAGAMENWGLIIYK